MSDHGPAACQALLQHRLIQAGQKTQLGSGSAPEAARTYPLSLLEWTANRKKANMALHVHCFDGQIEFVLWLLDKKAQIEIFFVCLHQEHRFCVQSIPGPAEKI